MFVVSGTAVNLWSNMQAGGAVTPPPGGNFYVDDIGQIYEDDVGNLYVDGESS